MLGLGRIGREDLRRAVDEARRRSIAVEDAEHATAMAWGSYVRAERRVRLAKLRRERLALEPSDQELIEFLPTRETILRRARNKRNRDKVQTRKLLERAADEASFRRRHGLEPRTVEEMVA